MASLSRWTWVWASSMSWWWTGSPGVLQSMGSQRVGQTEQLNWIEVSAFGVADQSLFFFIEPPPHSHCYSLFCWLSLSLHGCFQWSFQPLKLWSWGSVFVLQKGGPLPGPKTGLLSSTQKWIVRGDTSLSLPAHVSPRIIHFQVLDKSPVSGPGRGSPSCHIWTSSLS